MVRLIIFAACGLVAFGEPWSVATPPPLTRQEFTVAMEKITVGMTSAKVRRLLGAPDDVRTEYDPGGLTGVGTKEIWRYGTAGHLRPATLGEVYIDQQNRVQEIFGQGKPIPAGVLKEEELRRILDAL